MCVDVGSCDVRGGTTAIFIKRRRKVGESAERTIIRPSSNYDGTSLKDFGVKVEPLVALYEASHAAEDRSA